MRVLSVGCADGYVEAWLHRQLPDARIDAIEINPEFAKIARRRLGNAGLVKVGLAQDAGTLFKPHSYDAVVSYEVLEHVPDVDAFLAALEGMLKPGGRVYLSTPDGTFGTGHNPHHLRVYRSIDLVDLLRRRGRLNDAIAGQDGVAVASYTPSDRLADVAIYCGPGWQTWGPADIETKGLGGSETAAIRLAEALSEIGWVVTVYGQVEQGCYRDVIFRDWRTFDPTVPRQAVISSRIPALFDRPIAARHRLLWAHDTDFGPELTPARADRIDHILTLSRWHEQHVAGLYPFAKAKLERTRNGICHAYFQREPAPAREQRLVYTSSPDRGLDVLLELWPQIRDRAPEATLEWAYSPVYFEIARHRPEVAEHAEKVLELSQQDGVTALGSLTQPQVAQLMRSSMVWAAPSFNTPSGQPFCETSCIGAMEAQAAGCLVVASDWGALAETVKTGRLVAGPANSSQWRDAFVAEIVDGLTNPDTQAWAQKDGPVAVADMDWLGVGVQVAGLIR